MNGSDKDNCKEDTANGKRFSKRSVVLGIISATKSYTVEDLLLIIAVVDPDFLSFLLFFKLKISRGLGPSNRSATV